MKSDPRPTMSGPSMRRRRNGAYLGAGPPDENTSAPSIGWDDRQSRGCGVGDLFLNGIGA
jgi:hypothetical protein